PMTAPVVHVGTCIYAWSEEHQNRILTECWRPLLDTLRSRVRPLRFWFDRFDRRGPHLFCLLTVPPEAALWVRGAIAGALARFLAGLAPSAAVTSEEVSSRHAACAGKAFHAIDSEPGIADENTCRIFLHEGGYPFSLGSGSLYEAETWELVGDLSCWSLE